MDKEIREKIALKRYQIISPVLAEPARAQNEYFRKQAETEHEFPRYGLKKVRVSTMKAWLRKYRKGGFDLLKPKNRSDGGRPKRFTEDLLKTIEIKCEAHPSLSVQKLYEELRDQDLLGHPPVHYNTLLRVAKENGWLSLKNRIDVRKAYEVDNVNDLWISDFMHGPQVRTANRSVKAILCAIIDDHSRMVVGHAFSTSETISALTVVLKEAFLAYGIPKRFYVDNSSTFSSDLLTRSCAQAGSPSSIPNPMTAPPAGR
jgi:transposase InsO family protein